MTVKEGLQKAVELLDDGRNWTKFDNGGRKTREEGYCVLTACGNAFFRSGVEYPPNEYYLATGILAKICPSANGLRHDLVHLNDLPETTWPDIKNLFERAIAAAE